MSAGVLIFDDTVNEADEIYVVVLSVFSANKPEMVDLQERNASVCRITDNDGKRYQTYT